MATVANALDRTSGWRNLLGTVSRTGASAVAGGVLSVAASKLLAATSGPETVALLGTVQQLRQGAVTVAGLNGQTAIVQGTGSLNGTERTEFLRTAVMLVGFSTALVLLALFLMPEQIGATAGLPAEAAPIVRLLAPAVLCGSIYGFGVALLGGAGAVSKLAWVQTLGPAMMALLAYPAARLGTGWAVAALVTFSAMGGTLGAALAIRQTSLKSWMDGHGRWWTVSYARRLLTLSGALWSSALFANWVLVVTRARILKVEGLNTTGQFDAAWAISMNQTGLILSALQAHVLPSLARMRGPERQLHLSRFLVLGSAISSCLIVGLTVLKPLALRTLYSEQFKEAAMYLRWTLTGDYFKVTSWILSSTLLASARSGVFLAADLASYSAFGLTAWFLSASRNPAEAASIGFLAMYVLHSAICAGVLWLSDEYRPPKSVVCVWLAALTFMVSGSAAFWEQL